MNQTAPAASLAWMPWYVNDYVARTRGLSLQQRGALTDLIALAWITGPLPADQTRLATMIGVSTGEFKRLWPAICGWWSTSAQGQLINEELEGRRTEALRIYSARAQAGRESAKKRKQPNPATLNGHDKQEDQVHE